MNEDIFANLCILNTTKTYSKSNAKVTKSAPEQDNTEDVQIKVERRVPLTTKNAVKFLLEGRLRTEVCRYCLNVVAPLSELDQILHVGGAGDAGTTYKVTIRDMVASFHPIKVIEDPNLPDKICNKCLNLTISAYLFTQQCERSERALRNCLDNIYEKVDKLDPLERVKKRGRQKLNPNHNVIHAQHENVIDYAEPIINIINLGAHTMTVEPEMTELECKKCWQVLPNLESLLNHEKTHPDTMWFHCRLCGKSFPKVTQMKRHYQRVHVLGFEPKKPADKDFKCKECSHITDSYKLHLQHLEKHKFKRVMKHLVEKKMDRLCSVCLDRSPTLVELDKMICIHGGYPELLGDKPLYSVLASTLPDMNDQHNFLGTKICEKCLNHAITSYIFINQFCYARDRLDTCLTHMLKNLQDVIPQSNLFIQISEDTIMPIEEDVDETLLLDENDYIDEDKIRSEVLEDEFRVSESETEMDTSIDTLSSTNIVETFENPAKNVTKTYSKKKLVNGLQTTNYTDVCSEFLTFNKKKPSKTKCRYTCLLCSKNFITDYFLTRHILKHANKKVVCKICNRGFKSKFYLYEHKKMTHLLKQNLYYSCKVCGRTFLEEHKLKQHEKHHRTITCQLCNKIFISQTHLSSHLQRHAVTFELLSRKSVKNCSFCEQECLSDNELSRHVNKVHFQIKPYSCDMCERQFYTESNLKNHKKVHSMFSKETCAFCGKTLNSRRKLVLHVRKHIGVKPFGCQVCGQTFYTEKKARNHMKVYHGGRFCCNICKRTFANKSGLNEHINRDHNFI